MIKKICFYLLLTMSAQSLVYTQAAATAAIDCDPIVNLGVQAKTLQKALSLLAEQHHFDLTFPVDADRPVEAVDSMTLSQALKYLTADLNTVMQYEKVPGCARARLVVLEVLPVGEDTQYVYVKPAEEVPEAVQSLPQSEPEPPSPQEPVYIDNMELYAEEVLLNKRKIDGSLAPEQRQELMEIMSQVRERLEAEGLLKSANPLRNRTNLLQQ